MHGDIQERLEHAKQQLRYLQQNQALQTSVVGNYKSGVNRDRLKQLLAKEEAQFIQGHQKRYVPEIISCFLEWNSHEDLVCNYLRGQRNQCLMVFQ